MRFLIIDDDPSIRMVMQDILEAQGFEVIVAANGEEGLRAAAQKPDFIFCDIDMPALDGHAVLEAISRMPDVRDAPFVFLSARDERRDQRDGMKRGADDYVTKPFAARDILDVIAARTNRQRRFHNQIARLKDYRRREVTAQWSHELLTPLNAVLGMLDLIGSSADLVSPGELKEMLTLIREGAQRQEKLARKLITYFQLERALLPGTPPSEQQCEVSDEVQTACAQVAAERRREDDLVVNVDDGRLALPAELCRTAVAEVVDNALVFSPSGTKVTVLGTRVVMPDASGLKRYRLDVVDEGVGMTAEQRCESAAFIQFDRQRHEQQGLGLGLAIARGAAQLLGGDLILGPGRGNRGLTVTFDLPRLSLPSDVLDADRRDEQSLDPARLTKMQALPNRQ